MHQSGMERSRARNLPGDLPGCSTLSCHAGALADGHPQWRDAQFFRLRRRELHS